MLAVTFNHLFYKSPQLFSVRYLVPIKISEWSWFKSIEAHYLRLMNLELIMELDKSLLHASVEWITNEVGYYLNAFSWGFLEIEVNLVCCRDLALCS